MQGIRSRKQNRSSANEITLETHFVAVGVDRELEAMCFKFGFSPLVDIVLKVGNSHFFSLRAGPVVVQRPGGTANGLKKV
jgi:hypothetical protein